MARPVRKSKVKQVPLSEVKNDLSRYLREAEDLDVEHVAVDPLAGEELPRDVAAEDLEAALGIGDVAQADQRMHDDPETERAHAAVPRLRPSG